MPDGITDRELQFYYEGQGEIIFPEVYAAYNDAFFKTMTDGLKIDVEFEKLANTDFWEQYMLNAFQFSAAKSEVERQLIQQAIYDENKVKRSFSQFRNDVFTQLDIIHDHWWRVEYDLAVNGSIQAEKWRNDIWKNKDINPYATFVATMSLFGSKTCDECEDLNGTSFRVDSYEASKMSVPVHWNCFKADTKILTPGGWKRIDSLRIGDYIIGGSGNYQKVSFIHKNMFNGNLFKIINKRGSSFATNNHRIFTIKGWQTFESISNGDIIINKIKESFFDRMIRYINNCYVFASYIIMSLIINFISTKTFNSKIKTGDKNINPVRRNIIIKNAINTFGFNIIKHYLFVFSRFCFKISMSIGINRIRPLFTQGHFVQQYFIKRWIKQTHSFRMFFINIARFFSFTKSPMRELFSCFVKFFACFLFPFIIVYPLCLYSFTALTNWYIKITERIHNSPIISYFPAFLKLANRIKLSQIKFRQNNGSGAPFDRFNSFNEFLYSCFTHHEMLLVTGTNIVNYNDNVYNLSIENDETYITEIGIVHNCGCSWETSNDEDLQLSSEDELREKVNKNIDPMFQRNVGTDGIMPSKNHTYFDVLPNANKLGFENFGSRMKYQENFLNLATYTDKQIAMTLKEWSEKMPTGTNDLIFRNHIWKLNFRLPHASMQKIHNNRRGFENLRVTLEKPDEIWGRWENVKEQKKVLMNFLKFDKDYCYCVETKAGYIIDAYLLYHKDAIQARQKGIKFIK